MKQKDNSIKRGRIGNVLASIGWFAVCLGTVQVSAFYSPACKAASIERAEQSKAFEATRVKPAHKVITLAPSAAEIACSAGLCDRLVAVSRFTDHPAQAASLPKVADAYQVNIEQVIALAPDLIVAWRGGNNSKSLEQLDKLGFRLVYNKAERLAEIPKQIEKLTQFAPNPQQGIAVVKDFRQRLDALTSQYQSLPTWRYFYPLSQSPTYTVGQKHWPNDVFAVCGGVNIFADSEAAYPQVNIEQVMTLRPDVVVIGSKNQALQAHWQKMKRNFDAFSDIKIVLVDSDMINRPTVRALQAAEQLCKQLSQILPPQSTAHEATP